MAAVGGICGPTGSTRGMGVRGKGSGRFARFEAPAFIAGFDDVTMVGEPVEQRGRHHGVLESLMMTFPRPLGVLQAALKLEADLPGWPFALCRPWSGPLAR